MVIKLNKKTMVIVVCVILFTAALSLVGSGEAKQKIRLPVIMYHQVCTDSSKTGKYTVTVSELENDLIYLKNHGYSTVNTNQLADYVYNGEPLPQKPVLLTFDDGNESVFTLVEPLLKKYGMCCTCCVIGAVCDLYSSKPDHNIAYSHLTWDEVKALSEGSTVEIHSHSYDMHNCTEGKRKGMQRLESESEDEYIDGLYTDLYTIYNRLEQTGARNTAMFYPFGYYNDVTERVIKSMGYKLSFTCEERVNTLTCGNRECLYRLGRFNRPSGISSEEFFAFL